MTKRRLSQLELLAWQRITRNVRPLHPADPATNATKTNTAETTAAFATLAGLKTVTPTPQPPQTQSAVGLPPKALEIIRAAHTIGSRSGDAPPSLPKPRAQIANRKGERPVRRGKLDIDATLDLHGLTVLQAITRLDGFISQQRRQNARCLLVITGKGHPSEGKIRREFRLWLERPDVTARVSGYAQAHLKHGGAGAFYVFLRKPPQAPFR